MGQAGRGWPRYQGDWVHGENGEKLGPERDGVRDTGAGGETVGMWRKREIGFMF